MAARTIYIIGGMLLAVTSVCSTAGAQNFDDYFQQGVAYQNAGQHRSAAPMYEAALRVGNPNDVNYENAQANLGQVYGQLGQHARAEALLKSVVARHEAQQGVDDSLGKVLGDLGTAYGAQGKYKECFDCIERALEIRSRYHPL